MPLVIYEDSKVITKVTGHTIFSDYHYHVGVIIYEF